MSWLAFPRRPDYRRAMRGLWRTATGLAERYPWLGGMSGALVVANWIAVALLYEAYKELVVVLFLTPIVIGGVLYGLSAVFAKCPHCGFEGRRHGPFCAACGQMPR
jgi:hypothetical protein